MSVNKAQAEMRLILMMSLVMRMVGWWDGGKVGWWEDGVVGREKQTNISSAGTKATVRIQGPS